MIARGTTTTMMMMTMTIAARMAQRHFERRNFCGKCFSRFMMARSQRWTVGRGGQCGQSGQSVQRAEWTGETRDKSDGRVGRGARTRESGQVHGALQKEGEQMMQESPKGQEG